MLASGDDDAGFVTQHHRKRWPTRTPRATGTARSGSAWTRRVHGGDDVGLFCSLLGLGLGERGAEHTGLVVFEALDFGFHVLEAGLFGGEVGFVWFRRLNGCFDWDLGLWSGWFGGRNGFDWGVDWVVFRREALGL